MKTLIIKVMMCGTRYSIRLDGFLAFETYEKGIATYQESENAIYHNNNVYYLNNFDEVVYD